MQGVNHGEFKFHRYLAKMRRHEMYIDIYRTFHQVRQAKRSADLFMKELSSRLEVRQRRRFFPMDYLF